MPELKQTQAIAYLEPTLFILLVKRTREANTSLSVHLRNLILKDLQENGLLTVDVLVNMSTGSNENVLDRVAELSGE